jgi:indolepyruvate ferredoxin oxidoreductase
MTLTDDRSGTRLDPGDHWSPDAPRVHLSGVQAVVRFLIDALRDDRREGLRTAAFVSGYQGSPLAGFDRDLQRALHDDIDVRIVHRPAVNEELGATAVMGSQLATTLPSADVDGVLGVWYGKAPGLDRAMDALRHASFAGASAGGALALVGDDPSAQSSTLPSASEALLADLGMPIMYPRTLDEVIDLGRHAVALSRWSGAWVAMKLVTSVADAEGTVPMVPWGRPVLPDGWETPQASGNLLTPETLERERLVQTDRLSAAGRYADANGLNRLVVAAEHPRITLVTTGTVFSELTEALRLLGIGMADLGRLGVSLAEVRMPYPLGPGFVRSLSNGAEQVIVVEERKELVENQILSMVARRPATTAVLGRLDLDGRPFVPRHGCLDALTIARVLSPVLSAALGDAVHEPPAPRRRIALATRASRVPWFCAGCPHSVSTAVPDGMLLGEGIGCHSIVHYMPASRVGNRVGITQMGGEGAQWIGMAPFVGDRHLVQNMGDGTFFHSGQLAVRAAVAADVPITFKVLWNGATAMTGGQDVVGAVRTPEDLARLLLLERVRRVVITTDDLGRYRKVRLPPGASVRPREDVLDVQRELAAIDGVTVMVHDQACATELRRARKRGLAPVPAERVVINERVCEGCGDCQVKSNCLSLQTIDTLLGPKTRIDDNSCNVDLSCLKGDCPAFTLVPADAAPRADKASQAAGAGAAAIVTPVAAPAPVAEATGVMTVRIAGIGGTGVVTTAHLLAWAALLDDVEVWGLDQTGLSQKAGPVISDLRIGPGAADRSNLLVDDQVDVLLAADLLAAAQPEVLASLRAGRSTVVGASAASLSGPMVLGEQRRSVPTAELEAALTEAAGGGAVIFVDAVALAERTGASATVANVALLGVASQLGALPVSSGSIVGAIERNAVAVKANLAAFEAGRRWVADGCPPPDPPEDRFFGGDAGAANAARGLTLASGRDLPPSARTSIEWRAGDVADYQDESLARQFLDLVSEAWTAERAAGGDGSFAAAVAFGYHKLIAYKDEYEVARLLLEFPATAGKATWLLHPPALRSRGLSHKIRLGPWSSPAMRALRAARRVRGTRLDPFGKSELRRTERRLAAEYAEVVREVVGRLDAANLVEATAIASLPDKVRGYESVKERSLAVYQEELSERVTRLRGA